MSAWGRRFLSIIVGAVLAACCLFGGCHIAKDEITVYMPDGAPSVAFAKTCALQRDRLFKRLEKPKRTRAINDKERERYE
jgi:hypothetical protein